MPMLRYAVAAVGSLSSGLATGRESLQGVFIEAQDLTPRRAGAAAAVDSSEGEGALANLRIQIQPRRKVDPRRTQLEIYLQPDVENGRLRRGRVLHVDMSGSAGAQQKTPGGLSPLRNTHRLLYLAVGLTR